MPIGRRRFLTLAAIGPAMCVLASGSVSNAASQSRIKALAFDAFPIFDPRPVFALAEQLFPGKGAELSNVWRIR
jgi:2-haloacid dehalogenase